MRIYKQISNANGAAAVEFAIVVPLLLLLLFGIIEFSLLLYNKAMLTNASREGARFGIVYVIDSGNAATHHSADEIKQRVLDYAKDHLITFGADVLDAGDITVTPADPSSSAAGAVLEVKINYTYDFLVFPNVTQLIGGRSPNFLNLETVTKMRME